MQHPCKQHLRRGVMWTPASRFGSFLASKSLFCLALAAFVWQRRGCLPICFFPLLYIRVPVWVCMCLLCLVFVCLGFKYLDYFQVLFWLMSEAALPHTFRCAVRLACFSPLYHLLVFIASCLVFRFPVFLLCTVLSDQCDQCWYVLVLFPFGFLLFVVFASLPPCLCRA